MENDFSIEQYNYNLSDDKIAKFPLQNRDNSKLLLYKDEIIKEEVFKNAPLYIPTNSLLICNNTKVIKARLLFKKNTGALIEIFCLEPIQPAEYQEMFTVKQSCVWHCIIGNSKKWKQDNLHKEYDANNNKFIFTACRINSNQIEFSWNSQHTFGEVLEILGVIPIPPYLNRDSQDSDNEQYQTVYSKLPGSVAAPTAGLHFTDDVFSKLRKNNITISEVTLHVGAGTFKPVSANDYREHSMHCEHFSINKSVIEQILNHSFVTAIGTTSVRTLESVYWLGVKLGVDQNSELVLHQWDAYNLPQNVSVEISLSNILQYLEKHSISYFEAATEIMITPSYSFKIVSAMFTNFHQPKSTLLLLVSAFVGDDWVKIYAYALQNNFRFLSYGDSSLLFLKE